MPEFVFGGWGPTLRVAFLYAVVVGGVVGLLMVSAQLGIAAAVVATIGEIFRRWGERR